MESSHGIRVGADDSPGISCWFAPISTSFPDSAHTAAAFPPRRSVVGDSSQFIPRTVNAVVAAVRATGAPLSQVEDYPLQ